MHTLALMNFSTDPEEDPVGTPVLFNEMHRS